MSMHMAILKDGQLHASLLQKGYVTIPFLGPKEVGALVTAFSELNSPDVKNFYATSHSPDLSVRRKYSDLIKDTITDSFDSVFHNAHLLGASFVVKAPRYNEHLQPHQDWNIVDESKFRSYNIWIPLVDLDETNGAILVMPGTHKWLSNYRHSSIPCSFEEVHDLLWKYMTPLYLRAGEALIYDHALVHASFPNNSDKHRIACACGVIPSNAQMLFYRHNGEAIEEFESTPEFFMTENIFQSTGNLRKIRDIAYDFPKIKTDDFYRLSGIPTPKREAADEDKGEKVPFWKVYTPLNVFREIKARIVG